MGVSLAYGLGVDLGMTFAAAAVRRPGGVELASLGDRSAVVPSVVCVRAGGGLISGDAAERRAYQGQAECAREFKRRLGDPTPLILAGGEYRPDELLAAQLADIVAAVAATEGEAPADVVLTYPAVWGPYRREQFTEVARLAGVPDARLVTEPAAAATHYGATRDLVPGDTVVVYDLGGGTFDVTAVRLGPRDLELLGDPMGIEHLGGVDFDSAVMGYLDDALGGRISRLDPADPAAATTLTRLRGDCTLAKEALSVDTDIAVPVSLPTGHHVVRLTRAALEDLIRPMLRPTLDALHGMLRSAALTPADLTAILLVGGSSRMPLVRELVGAEFGRPIRTDSHPKHAVALGAATLTRVAVSEPALRGIGTIGGGPTGPDRTRRAGGDRVPHRRLTRAPKAMSRQRLPARRATRTRAGRGSVAGGRNVIGRDILPGRGGLLPRTGRKPSTAVTIAVVVLLAVIPVVVPVLVLRGGSATMAGPDRAAAPVADPGSGGPPVGSASTQSGIPTGTPARVPTGTPARPRPAVSAGALIPSPPAPVRSSAGTPRPTGTSPGSPAPANLPPPAAHGMNLVVASLSWSPSQPRTGDPVGFTAVIRNIGDRTTENGHGGIGVSFLVDGNEVDWVYCSNDPPLLPGGQRTCVADQFDGQTKKWQATAGSHRVSAFVDDLGSFAETNEGDNTLTRTLTVA